MNSSSSSSTSEEEPFNSTPVNKKLSIEVVDLHKEDEHMDENERIKEDKDQQCKNKVYSQFTPEIIECL